MRFNREELFLIDQALEEAQENSRLQERHDRLAKLRKRFERSLAAKNATLCESCGQFPGEVRRMGEWICPGCDAYRDHQS